MEERRMQVRRIEPNMFLRKMKEHKRWARNLIWSAPLEEEVNDGFYEIR